MLPGIRILRVDTVKATIVISYHVGDNVWRLQHLPYDEFRVLMDDDMAFPL